MKTVKSIQECIDAVKAGVVAVSKDTYPNNPVYHICESQEEFDTFNWLVKAVKDAPRGTFAVSSALETLEKFIGRPCLSDHLHFIFIRNEAAEHGGWIYATDLLLQEEWDDRQEEEDYRWFESARENFAKEE